MKAVRLASLGLWVVLVALAVAAAAGVMWIPALGEVSPATRLAAMAGILGVAYAAILFPAMFAIRGVVAGLRGYIETATSEQGPAVYSGPRWSSPLTGSLTSAMEEFIQRENWLCQQIRDLEIRYHVAEAERRQIEAVLHALRHPVIVTDAFNELVISNEAAGRVLGFVPEESVHQPIETQIHDERLCQLIHEAREQENFSDYRHVEHEIRSEDELDAEGEQAVKVYDVTLACVPNHKQELGGVITILHDLTRERELSQMKSEFVSKASHELRTPLSSIRALIEMLVDGEATDEESRNEFYQIIQNETERLGRLIDNMLNISRIEAGIIQITRESVDLKVLVERALETLDPQAREKEITLNAKLAPVDLCVEGDADMLYQVVLNVMSNAVKYTPEGGRVTISADSDNLTRTVLVTVSDTGLGIPPDALPKLFDKFFRVENYKHVAKGTGLGLSLCKHIVETVHQGQIGVDSKLGMGSKFWFSVPMRYAGSRAAA